MSDDVFLDYAGDTGSYLFPGGDGYDTIIGVWTVGADVVFDLRNDTLDSIEQLEIGSLIDGAGPDTGSRATMKLNANQVPVWFVGNYLDRPSIDVFEITMGVDTVLDLSNTGVSYFARGDHIRVVGDGADETITGSWATDVIQGRNGKDSIDGGDGWDIADYSEKSKRVDITLKAGQWVDAVVGGTKEDRLHSIEAIFGGKAGDRLTGDSGGNLLAGGGGKDTMDGGGGSDWADYSDKTKRVEVTLNRSHAVTVMVGGVAEDTIRNFENVVGGSAGDVLTGDSRANQFTGGAGKDSIDGAAGLDTADYSEKIQAVRIALNGSNWVDVRAGGVKEDRIRNIEKLIGGYGNDTLSGDGGANTLQGAVGSDRLDGKGGIDTADYSDRPYAILVDLNGSNFVDVSVNGIVEDHISNIENIIGSFADDSITGDAGSNVLNGGGGNDALFGDGGVDTLKGGNGNDELHVSADGVHPAGLLDGGAGGDTLVIADHVGSYVADLRALTINSIETFAFGDPGTGGTATIEMNAAQFVAVGWTVHGTIVGSGQTDVLEIHMGDHGQIELGELVFDNFDGHLSVVGTSDGQYFYGSTIADSIAAGGGQDALFYTTGYDTLDGGAGDAIDGHSDQVVFSGAVGGVILTLNGSADSIYKVNGIDSGVVRNIEGVTGSEGNDSITGDSGDNWLNGNGGSDTIDGGDGIDTLTFLGGWAYSAYVDLAAGTYSVLSSGLPGASTISNIENVIGSGSLSGDDNANVLDSSWGFGGTLLGRGGNDSLIANVLGLGGSHLDGGAGQDSLRGGGGADTFVFSALTDSGPGGNRDVILGFDTGVGLGASVGDDVIDVSALFAGDLVYRGTNAFDGLGQLRVRASGSDVIVEVNAEGDLAADFSIRLSGTTLASMTASDFIL